MRPVFGPLFAVADDRLESGTVLHFAAMGDGSMTNTVQRMNLIDIKRAARHY
jgi:hypothetical protein